jgi:hypothetical protein
MPVLVLLPLVLFLQPLVLLPLVLFLQPLVLLPLVLGLVPSLPQDRPSDRDRCPIRYLRRPPGPVSRRPFS